MKKIVALLLGLLMVFGVCSATAEATTVNPGAELSFDISISSPSGTDAKIGIKTNGAPVTFKSATGGPTNDVVPPKAFDGFFVLVNDAGISIVSKLKKTIYKPITTKQDYGSIGRNWWHVGRHPYPYQHLCNNAHHYGVAPHEEQET